MELLQLFQDCVAKTISVKQAFSFLGLGDITLKSKPFKEMDEKTVLACLINWMINQMPTERKPHMRISPLKSSTPPWKELRLHTASANQMKKACKNV